MIDLGVAPSNPENMQDNDITAKLLAEISEDAIDNVNDWFTNYSNTCAGVDKSFEPIKWINSVRYLKYKRDKVEDKTNYDSVQ